MYRHRRYRPLRDPSYVLTVVLLVAFIAVAGYALVTGY